MQGLWFDRHPTPWRSKKHNVGARSSVEAGFKAMALEICELLWPKIILKDLKIN